MLIRPLTEIDYDAWLPLWIGYQRFYEVEIAPDVTDETWQRLMSVHEPMNAYGAEIDGELAGIVHTVYHRSTWTRGNYCYLQDLFTAEAYRGRGIGRALIEWVYQEAKGEGASRVYWLTQENNAAARALYDKIASRSGFIQYRHVF